MHIKYPKIYAMLKAIGHAPMQADRILMDAHRGDKWALSWIRMIHRATRQCRQLIAG